MIMDNVCATSEGYFILLDFSRWPHLEVIFFVVILVFYLMALMGNLFIIVLSQLGACLCTPCTSSSQTSASWISAPPLSCW